MRCSGGDGKLEVGVVGAVVKGREAVGVRDEGLGWGGEWGFVEEWEFEEFSAGGEIWEGEENGEEEREEKDWWGERRQ
ncbi:unnamed protein product [Ilex paraguariensis]|uniref:Uncharacterized protein n=1 Tax=Ilex paraguariensis TaxID=185542 RepID=A0ABC8R8M5_9AQUA